MRIKRFRERFMAVLPHSIFFGAIGFVAGSVTVLLDGGDTGWDYPAQNSLFNFGLALVFHYFISRKFRWVRNSCYYFPSTKLNKSGYHAQIKRGVNVRKLEDELEAEGMTVVYAYDNGLRFVHQDEFALFALRNGDLIENNYA